MIAALGRAVCAALAMLCLLKPVHAEAPTELAHVSALQAPFDRAALVGVIVVRDPVTGQFMTNDPDRAAQRFVPASTFKIANTLIALETGAVRSVDEVVPYGGGRQPFPAWEREMSLREALPISNVAVFRTVARRVGLEGYQTWLPRLGYGSEEPGQDLTGFWLRGPVSISAFEQVNQTGFIGEV